jgi:hypothetical protein
MADRIPRTVTYDDRFYAQAKKFERDFRRLDEMVIGAEWTLARSPYLGLNRVVLNPGGGMPKLEVWADVGESLVIVTGIDAVEGS